MEGDVTYRVRHETLYQYSGVVAHSQQLLHLAPRVSERQVILEHALILDPVPALRRDAADAFGNPVSRLEFDRPYRSLRAVADMKVRVSEGGVAAAAADTETWESVRGSFTYRARPLSPTVLQAMPFRMQSPHIPIKHRFTRLAEPCFGVGTPVLVGAEALMKKLHGELTYAPGETSIATPLFTVLEKKRGVCQDYAHLMIACLRAIGLPARYVSGYLRTAVKDGVSALVGADASHAWVSVYCPPLGWVDLDPTNNVRVGTDHITVAWGRDFGDVSPLRGVILGGGSHELGVRVVVRREE